MRKNFYLFSVIAVLGSLVAAGCTNRTAEPAPKGGGSAKESAAAKSTPAEAQDDEAEITKALAQLSPEDRRLAEAQRWCAVNSESRLGEMDMPHKIMVKGQPVFLCCGGCKKKAEADPDRTLAKVEELKKKAAAAPQK
jgi:hypothetical protein